MQSSAGRCGFWAFQRSTTTARRPWCADGEIVAAAQEERFTRKKHDAALSAHAIALLPARGRASSSADLDYVVFYDKPFSSSSACSRPISPLRRAGLRSFPHGDAALDQGKALLKNDCSRASSRARRHWTSDVAARCCSPSTI